MMSNILSFWTEERVALLTRLWADGPSASQIAARLGTSRNAVLGKVHRLELPARCAGINMDLREAQRLGLVPRRMKPRRTRQLSKPKTVAIVTPFAGVSFIKGASQGWTKPSVPAGTSKTSPEYRKHLGLAPEMTPNQRRNFLAEAVRNTQAMQRS